ncbi:nucleolar and coiled-body phosphoprotein 1 [Drosophila miranda]|uniref:nucleolar and coiled-body phosphoprotein 1 n=1 Tax=Drosophila miranda TaxID=7229 RepID=UPI0007E6D6A2|nr:nucleolar and coiled-body phosphoprotein 1 [Drosophila miranda]
MSAYEDMSQKQPQRRLSSIWLLLLTLLLFVSTLTVVALIEAERAQSGDADVLILNRMWSHFQTATRNDTKEETATVERIAREASNSSVPNQPLETTRQSKDFYEEQRAVVVNAENMDPIVAQRQDSFGPPESREDSNEQDPYYDAADDYGPGHYPYQQEEPQQSEENFYGNGDGSSEGRAAQPRPYDGFYAPWKASPVASRPTTDGNNRKLQAPPNRAPYPAYDEVYDYPMGFQRRPQAETPLAKQAQTQPQPTQHTAIVPVQEESTLVTVLKSLKQLWDLYQALMSAWNSMTERHQKSTEKFRKEQAEKQAEKDRLRQQQQQKLRINSKKPPRIEGDKKNQNKKSTTTKRPTSTSSTTPAADSSEEEEKQEKEATSSTSSAQPEPQKGEKADVSSVRGLRQRREAAEEDRADTDVGEGRYIKGDPLNGYYDFVITEGSYKFWAAFQVGTALLIIYSTFAAIYYSKVNPLTSDYDYTDYLGGVRSLSGGDADFVDDADAPPPVSTTSRIMEWLPRTAHSVKFILDAIEKMPLDHGETKEPGWGSTETATAEETS